MQITRLAHMLLVGAVTMIMAAPAQAQSSGSGPVTRAELKELLIRIADRLDRSPGQVDAAKVRERIETMDVEAFEYLYRFSGNWQKLRIAVNLMSAGEASQSEQTALAGALALGNMSLTALSPAGLPASLFATAYPVGSNYTTFRATLPGLGAMIDTPGSVPGLDDERCDSNFEAGVAIAAATFAFANTIAETVCEALPDLADIPCWVAQGALQVAAEANNTVAAQCAIVDGAINAAEIEAAYENTRAILLNLDAHHLALTAHDADVKSGILSIISNDNTNTGTIINNDNANTATIINNDNANKNELRDLLLRTQIEADLAAADSATPVALYLTPNANGGYLDLVQSIVTQTLANVQAAGGKISNAQQFLNQADALKASGQFKAAYDNYQRAYKLAAN
jgi:hypothetical protein